MTCANVNALFVWTRRFTKIEVRHERTSRNCKWREPTIIHTKIELVAPQGETRRVHQVPLSLSRRTACVCVSSTKYPP